MQGFNQYEAAGQDQPSDELLISCFVFTSKWREKENKVLLKWRPNFYLIATNETIFVVWNVTILFHIGYRYFWIWKNWENKCSEPKSVTSRNELDCIWWSLLHNTTPLEFKGFSVGMCRTLKCLTFKAVEADRKVSALQVECRRRQCMIPWKIKLRMIA